MEMDRRTFIKAAAGAAGVLMANGAFAAGAAAPKSGPFPAHGPIGQPRGIHPGRVAWIHKPGSVHWDGVDYWWKQENYDRSAILAMIQAGIMQLAGKESPAAAWKALFEWKNQENGGQGGYKHGQKIAVKTNMNGAGEYNDDPHGRHAAPYGNPVLLQQLLVSLVQDGGVSPADITVFDTMRIFPDYMQAMCEEGILSGVRFKYRDVGGAKDAVADKSAPINWSGPVRGEVTYFPKCVTEAAYLINLANVKGHSWGLTLAGKNHFGSFVNSDRRRTPAAAGLHDNIINGEMGGYSVLADLISNPQLDAKTVLWLLDGLVTAPSETGAISPDKARWKMAPFNGDYACSLFFSQDPLAIDSVGADFLVNEPTMRRCNSGLKSNTGMENYMHEAALLANPPSGVKYKSAKRPSLGVHEHWNNVHDKQYSGNFKPGSGVELVYKKL